MQHLVLRSSVFFICYLIFLLVGGVALIIYSKTDIFLFINSTNSYSSDFFFKYYTNVGDGIFYGLIIIALLFYKYKYSIIAGVCFLITSVEAQFIKRLIFTNEFRPSKYFQNTGIEFHIIDGVKLYSNNSFPSGHATTAFSIFCLLSLIFPKKKYGFLFFIFAFLAAYSRVYVGQHFFADIYCGSIIGVVSTVILFYILEKYFEKLNKEWPNRGLLKGNNNKRPIGI